VRYEVCSASSWFSFDTGYTGDTDAPSRWFQPATKSSVKGGCEFRDEPLQRGPPGCPSGPADAACTTPVGRVCANTGTEKAPAPAGEAKP
jgi:hypothetical protein